MTYEEISPVVRRVLAPNPGPMTLDGTNTWVIGDPQRTAPLVVDPGPDEEDHLRRVLEVAGGRLGAIWITHRHHDHTDGAERLAELADCAVMAADPAFASDQDAELGDGYHTLLDTISVTVLATPGHTSDSLSFLVSDPARPALLITGDMVLGRGTTVITHPDGDLAAYFDSLELMITTVDDHGVAALLPGHGDRVKDPAGVLRFYRQHRRERLEQVQAAVAAGDRTPAEVVRRVYADTDPALWPAAEQSVRAQLEYLDRHG
jgi:glyoxylase-like metal-dependent hydrolase (beta-lactamase superfamily II)